MKTSDDSDGCSLCEKPRNLCFCAAVDPLENKVFVLILRHPQEQDKRLGTARMTIMQLKNAALRTGLSWANLSKAAGRLITGPKKYGVLYLGTAKASNPSPSRVLTVLTRKGNPAPDQDEALKSLEGIIILDGNWAQAKALWWRNPWLLKCRRLVLYPPHPSLYGSLRKEPRCESVSTIESAAYALSLLENDPALPEKILKPFRHMLDCARGQGAR
ncbi:MAG: DTW domain-containing protein [Proteobacteria bacterium]|nr:DTW domain-containing protein [Pseudomonadota bacterium]